MASGTIKKLVSDKGFGFIQTGDGADLFFHHSSVEGGQFDRLTEGQQVEFTVEQGQGSGKGKGPRAASVTPATSRGPNQRGPTRPPPTPSE